MNDRTPKKKDETVDISDATRRNWARLTPNRDEKLTSRANKRASRKFVVPLEYFENRRNVEFVRGLVEPVRAGDWTLVDVLFSLTLNLLRNKGLKRKRRVRDVLDEFETNAPLTPNSIAVLERRPVPDDEFDLLGLVYRAATPEGEKNRAGAYYTPRRVAAETTRDFDFSGGATFFDPCCGSGAFFLALKNVENPERLFGVDVDPIAVFLTKINMLLRFSEKNFVPNIICADFLRTRRLFDGANAAPIRFNYIATNPPWGAVATSDSSGDQSSEIMSNETFSHFFVRAFERLQNGGRIRFLFPASVLNVKKHKDLRSFVLRRARLDGITLYPGAFSGVATKYVDLDCRRAAPSSQTIFRTGVELRDVRIVETSAFFETKNCVFRPLDSVDLAIIRTVKKRGKLFLDNSLWALGIVVGDNENVLRDAWAPGLEPIYTGKEVAPFSLAPPRKFLRFDRSRLQQVAKEEFYRTPKKLAYKFVSDRLVFALDESRSLFLNSANLLIPRVPGASIETVLGFFNSELFHFLYSRLFGEIKILKGNLCELPFPELSRTQDFRISTLVERIRAGERAAFEPLQREIFDVFELEPAQIRRIREFARDSSKKTSKKTCFF